MFGLQNRAITELQIGTGFRARWITIRVRFIDFKSEKKDFKSGQGLQIGAGITNSCRTQIMYYTKDLQKTFHLNYKLLNFSKYNRKESERADDAAFSAACKKVLLIGYHQEINITETCSQEKHRKT